MQGKDFGFIGGVTEVLTVISGVKALYDFRKDWKQYKEKNGVAGMSLYELNQKHKNGELDEDGKEFADKFFGQRVECSECGQYKRLGEFSYPG